MHNKVACYDKLNKWFIMGISVISLIDGELFQSTLRHIYFYFQQLSYNNIYPIKFLSKRLNRRVINNYKCQGTWMTQSGDQATFDIEVVSLSPRLGIEIT